MDSDLTVITEGATKAQVFKDYLDQPKGPKGHITDTVFYNPEMALCRDLGVGLVSVLERRKWSALDGMAGTGIRGLRLAIESHQDIHVLLNDHNPVAYRMMLNNIEMNGVANATAVNKKLGTVLAEEAFDLIDLDPFGTPVHFIHPALCSIRNKGVLAVTATDTAVLCGTYNKACRRRYLATPIRSTIMHEAGLRILMGFIVREAAKLELGAAPLMAHATQHYMRIYARFEKGSKCADRALAKLGTVVFDPKTQTVSESGPGVVGGPLWKPPMQDPEVLGKMVGLRGTFARPEQYADMCETLLQEAGMPAWFYEINKVGHVLKMMSPSMSDLSTRLESMGYRWCRSHIAPNTIRTDAPYEDFIKAFKGAHGEKVI